ncbi:hypothetical protein [Paenibacillus wynnii]|uniref:hypothetical protein n=1 Tax=Paenibacillus wynnii TaxID=268407 RepID=UPI0027903D3D|nr:hypothetical protein [Paenibacillus wynnii]MDQ0193208.1 hypothetical protein [Paenibacillus wynnii]
MNKTSERADSINTMLLLRMLFGISFGMASNLGVATGTLLLGSIAMFTSYAVMYRFSALAPGILLVVYITYLAVNARSSHRSTYSVSNDQRAR